MHRALVLLTLCGCFHIDPISEIQRPFKEAERARQAAQWAGTYVFTECAANAHCWRYTVTIAQDGSTGMVSVDGDSEPTRVNAKPRPRENTVTFQFESYADDRSHYEWIPAGLGPAFRPGERLVALVRRAGKMCLHFERLESRLNTSEVCAQ